MKWENGEKEREGEERKAGSRARLERVCPARLREGEGDVNSPASYPYQGNRHFTCREFKLLLA